MNKLEFLQSIQPTFKATLNPTAVYPCEIGEGDHHLWIRGSQTEARKNKKRRSPGYWDISVVPLKNAPCVVLRVWTYDGGTGINQKLFRHKFADTVIAKREGLRWRYAKQKGGDMLSGHGLYDFYREDGMVTSSSYIKRLIEDCIAIENALLAILEK